MKDAPIIAVGRDDFLSSLVNLFLNINIANDIANGGTIPPTINAADGSNILLENIANPKAEAVLLIGPPISDAIIPANIAPNNTLLVPDILCNQDCKASFNHDAGVLTTKNIIAPLVNAIKSGHINTAFTPFNTSGKFSVIFITPKAIYPVAKPATIPPINPEPPITAIKPAIIAGANPCLPAIDLAIKPASIGINNLNAESPPSCPKNPAIGLYVS